MKRGTDLKLKFKLLKAKLRLSSWEAKGVLQSIWDFTQENTPLGDIGRYTDEQIALGIEWPAERAGELVTALVSTNWVNRHPLHRLVVHDWHEHCEEWLRKRVNRAGQDFASWQTTADNGSLAADTGLPSGSLPDPDPDPVPDPVPSGCLPESESDGPVVVGDESEQPDMASALAKLERDVKRAMNILSDQGGDPDEQRLWLRRQLRRAESWAADERAAGRKMSPRSAILAFWARYFTGKRWALEEVESVRRRADDERILREHGVEGSEEPEIDDPACLAKVGARILGGR